MHGRPDEGRPFACGGRWASRWLARRIFRLRTSKESRVGESCLIPRRSPRHADVLLATPSGDTCGGDGRIWSRCPCPPARGRASTASSPHPRPLGMTHPGGWAEGAPVEGGDAWAGSRDAVAGFANPAACRDRRYLDDGEKWLYHHLNTRKFIASPGSSRFFVRFAKRVSARFGDRSKTGWFRRRSRPSYKEVLA